MKHEKIVGFAKEKVHRMPMLEQTYLFFVTIPTKESGKLIKQEETVLKKILLLCSFIFWCSASVLSQSVLTNDSVIEMVKSGLSNEIIAAKIRSSETNFDTTNEGLKKLTESKVHESVVVAMIDRQDAQKQTAKAEAKESNKLSESIPEQGTLADIKDKKNVYIFSEDTKSRDKIVKELAKKNRFEVVDKIEDSDFVMKFVVWTETIGSTGSVYGNTATITEKQVRVGVLTVMMPSQTSNRIRLIYSNKQTQRGLLLDHPAEKTTKQFLKDLAKLK